MSARERVRLGQFLSRRLKDPDDPADFLAPGGVLDPEKSFLEINLPSDEVVPSVPAVVPRMPPPPLGTPAVHGLGATPPLTPTSLADPQPSLATVPAAPPAGPIPVAEPPRTVVAAAQPFQGGGLGPSVLPGSPDFAHAPNGQLPEMPAPDHVPNGVQPGPVDFLPAPNGVQPAMPAPDHTGPSQLPAMPAPPIGSGYAPGGSLPAGRSPLDDLANADSRIIDVLRKMGGDQYAEHLGFPFGGQGDLALSPDLYAKHVGRLGADIGKIAVHTGIQLALFLQNNRGRIWNPLMMAPPPVAINYMSPALDVGLVMTPPAANRDIHREMAEGVYSVDRITPSPPFYDKQSGIGSGEGGGGGLGAVASIVQAVGGRTRLVGALSQASSIVDDPTQVPFFEPIVRAGLEQRNLYTSDRTYSEQGVNKVADLVDAVIDGKPHDLLTDDMKTTRYRVSSNREPQKLAKMFEPEKRSIVGRHEWRPKSGLAMDKGSPFLSRLDAAAFPNGVIPAKIRGENDFGFAVSDSGRPPSVDDDDAYVPLSFTDLRPITGLKYRTVYFRPFNITLSENFSPQWNKANFWGRTDAVATYMSTARSWNLGFMVQAFGPEDVRTIYQKLTWLTSMVYPEYDKDLIMKSGPVTRVRVGDVMNALGPEGTRGLPGIIENLDFDYSESLWELKRDWKVPVTVKISVAFTVLHDRPIGRGGLGKFGGIGSVKEGRYIPPSMQDGGPNSNSRDFVDMDQGENSFRPVGNANDYTLENIIFDDSEK